MAFAIVAMMAFCSVSVIFADSDAASNNNETYTIHLRVGDTFTYTPEVNLQTSETASVVIAVDTGSSAGMVECLVDGVFTFTPTTTDQDGEKVIFKATWKSGSLIQYAYQTIVFKVWDQLSVSGGKSVAKAISTDCAVGEVLYTPLVSGGINTYTYEPTIPAELQSYIGFTDGSLVTKAEIPTSLASATPYTITIKVSDAGYPADPNGKSNALDPASIIITVKLTITNSYIIVAPASFETFAGSLGEGETRADWFSVSTNADTIGDISGETITVSAVDSGSNAVADLVSYADGRVTVDLSKAVFSGSETYRDYVVRINANANSTSLGDVSATANVNMRIYADLSFVSEPTISPGSTQSVSNNPMDMILTATFSNTTKITYYWGDGTVTTVNTNGSEQSTYSARHIYSEPGVYYISVYAENSAYNMADGNATKMITMYNAAEGGSNVVDDVPEKGFFEKHGYQFLIFAVIAVICLAAFFIFGVQSPVVILAAIIAGTFAALSYIYCDLGGILDALRGLF